MADHDNVKAGWITGFWTTTVLTGEGAPKNLLSFNGDVFLEVHPFVGEGYPSDGFINGIRGVGAGSARYSTSGTGVVGLGGPSGGNGVLGAAGAGDPGNADLDGNFVGVGAPSQLGTGVEGQGSTGGGLAAAINNNVIGVDVGFWPGIGVLGIGGPPIAAQIFDLGDKPTSATSVSADDLGGGPGVVGLGGGTPAGKLPSFNATRCSGVFGWGAPTVSQGAGLPDHPPGRGGIFGSPEIAAIRLAPTPVGHLPAFGEVGDIFVNQPGPGVVNIWLCVATGGQPGAPGSVAQWAQFQLGTPVAGG
jgi:hypothetical protein